MSFIDPGLLPHVRRSIYGDDEVPHHHRGRRTTRVRPKRTKQDDFGGYETDTEDNKTRIHRSPPRPDPTAVLFGGYEVSRATDEKKRKRRSTGASTKSRTNRESDSGAPVVPYHFIRRRRFARMKKRQSDAGAVEVAQPEVETLVEELAADYSADDEKAIQSVGEVKKERRRSGRGGRKKPRKPLLAGWESMSLAGDGDVETTDHSVSTRSRKG